METNKEDGRLKHLDKARAEGLNSRKGKPNKATANIKVMIEEALVSAGGAAYFQRQAEENPSAFMQLVGKLLPKNVSLDIDMNVRHESILEQAMKDIDSNPGIYIDQID